MVLLILPMPFVIMYCLFSFSARAAFLFTCHQLEQECSKCTSTGSTRVRILASPRLRSTAVLTHFTSSRSHSFMVNFFCRKLIVYLPHGLMMRRYVGMEKLIITLY